MEIDSLITEIDITHESANMALKNKNFTFYLDHFSENLEYTQANGLTITKKQLSRDIKIYFSRIKNYNSTYQRLNHSFENNCFTEKLIQEANVSIRIFIFLSKKWTIQREGIYKWIKVNGTWKIENIVILKETFS